MKSLKMCRDLAVSYLKLAKHGIDPIEEQKRREEAEVQHILEGATFEQLTKQFLKEYAKKLRSYYEVKRSFDQYFLPKFGKVKARELKRADARTFLDGMAQSKPVMANRCLAYVRKMYNWALSKDLVEFNPIMAIPRPGTEKTRDRVLSADEIKALWMALDNEKPIMAATFRLRLLTAQRGGEVHAMRWKDIDGEWWTIPSEFSKNKLSHRVPLSPQALKALNEVQETTDRMDEKMGRERSEWVFPNPADRSQHVYSIQKLASGCGQTRRFPTGHTIFAARPPA
jgi:integrase